LNIRLLKNPGKEELQSIEEYFTQADFPNFFHSPSHFLSARSNLSTTPKYMISYDDAGEIDGLVLLVTHREKGLILKNFTRRAVVYEEPLTGSAEVQKQLTDHLLGHVRNSHLFLQFRINRDSHPVLEDYNGVFSRQDYLNVFIPNKGPDTAWQSLSRSKRWQIRKNLENNVKIVEADGEKDLQQWYRILQYLYKYRVQKPVPPLKFFRALLQNGNSVNYTRLLVVKHSKEVIGGILLPVSGTKCVHEWYICGADRTYKPLNIYPSVMATWAGIDFMVQNGFDYFDFMGAGRPDVPYGVREFKERFGGELVDVVRYTHFPPNIYAGLFRKLNWL